jgi:hypothetical protein
MVHVQLPDSAVLESKTRKIKGKGLETKASDFKKSDYLLELLREFSKKCWLKTNIKKTIVSICQQETILKRTKIGHHL